jgi:uncharacterized membrane protein
MPEISEITPLTFIQKNAKERKLMINRLKEKVVSSRTLTEKVVDFIAKNFGTLPFLSANVLFFVFWIIVNLGLIPGIAPFDPFPFGLLTMLVSLEAILVTIFVLISQSRSEKFDDLRENMDLFFEMYTEAEITKLIKMTKLIAEKNQIDLGNDPELQEIMEPIDLEKIESLFEEKLIVNSKKDN